MQKDLKMRQRAFYIMTNIEAFSAIILPRLRVVEKGFGMGEW